jgi:hypothetical protein
VNIEDLSLIRVAERIDAQPEPDPETRRIRLAETVIVVALAVLAVFVAALMVTWSPVPRPVTHSPAPVGSGLHLPLNGGDR